MDRSKAPELKQIKQIDFIAPEILPINEHVNLYFMSKVPNETSRMDLYFDGGTVRGNKGTSSFVNGLLLSGNEKLSATEISHQIDLQGGFFESGITTENSVISIYALKENMPNLISFIKSSIQEMSCVEKEMNELVQDKKQKFQVNLQKTRFLAQREFQKRIFASNEVYSNPVTPDFYENVNRDELVSFFKKNYLAGLTKVSLVGDFEREKVNQFVQEFKSWAIDHKVEHLDEMKNEAGTFHVEKEGALQTAIRVGRILFNKKHSDYTDFNVLNTILGDYFGSRLMTNIREDKGYTYGIGSMIAEYNDFGYFMIGTEVGKEAKEATLVEIQNEFQRLREELVPNEELDLVKNYLLGQLLKSADGPYSMMDLYLSAQVHGKDLEFYNESIEKIQSITPERIQELAQKYLVWEEMSVVSAG